MWEGQWQYTKANTAVSCGWYFGRAGQAPGSALNTGWKAYVCGPSFAASPTPRSCWARGGCSPGKAIWGWCAHVQEWERFFGGHSKGATTFRTQHCWLVWLEALLCMRGNYTKLLEREPCFAGSLLANRIIQPKSSGGPRWLGGKEMLIRPITSIKPPPNLPQINIVISFFDSR